LPRSAQRSTRTLLEAGTHLVGVGVYQSEYQGEYRAKDKVVASKQLADALVVRQAMVWM
jgi:hypothetical protein